MRMQDRQVTGSVTGTDTPWGPPLSDDTPAGGRYVDLGIELGRGGQGQVRLAHDTRMDRKVAVKTLHDVPDASKVLQRLLSEETLAASRLQHPHILTVLDAFRSQDRQRIHLVTPYVAGRTLKALVRDSVRGTARDAETGLRNVLQDRVLVDIVIDICEALSHAHVQGLAHRDIKSENVLVVESPGGVPTTCYLIDWGLASPVVEVNADPSGWSLPARRGGTATAMAPEVGRGDVVASLHADVYSVGVLIYEVLEGRRPKRGSRAMMQAHFVDPQVPHISRDSHPPGLAALATRCLAIRPEDRPTDAREVLDALQAWRRAASRYDVADRLVEEVTGLLDQISAHQRLCDELVGQVRAARAQIVAGTDDGGRAAAWALESRMDAVQDELVDLHAQVDLRLRAALASAPEHEGARVLLGERLAGQLISREQRTPAERRRLEVELQSIDHQGHHSALLKGLGTVSLQTSRPARLRLEHLQRNGDRLDGGTFVYDGPGELRKWALPEGSYIAHVQSVDGVAFRMPLWIERGRHCIVGEDDQLVPIVVPMPGECRPDEVYVPRGYSFLGGDPRAQGDRVFPARRMFVDRDLFVARRLTTVAQWCAFLDGLWAEGQPEQAGACVPRCRDAHGQRGAPVLQRLGDRGFQPVPDPDGDVWAPQWPIVQVTLAAVRAYLAWRARTDGIAARLPREDEWVRYARGADLRIYPWGYQYELGWAGLGDSQGERRQPYCVGSFPRDCSVFGDIRDLAGNAMERIDQADEPEPRFDGDRLLTSPPARTNQVRGGNWASAPGKARLGGRPSAPVDTRSSLIGFRVVRTRSDVDA